MRLIYLIFTLLTINLVYGQQFITLEGCITDAETSQPIGFAAISLKNSSIGTVSNTAGYYVFHIPEKKRNDTLLVSSVGYKAFILPLKSIVGKKLDIKLKPKVYSLSEVAVKPKDAAEIVRQAIAKIPENYPDKPINMDGFYREMTFENDTCVEMAEAACEFYYKPYNETVDFRSASDSYFEYSENHYNYFWNIFSAMPTNPDDRLDVIEGRSTNLFHKNHFKVVPRGGPMALTAYDYPKSKYSPLDFERLKKYKFVLDEVSSYEDRQVYVVSFHNKKKKSSLYGKLFIDIKSFAFVKIIANYKINDKIKQTRYWNKALYKKKRKKCKDYIKNYQSKYTVNYKKINNKWYLHFIESNDFFDYEFSKHYVYKDNRPKYNYKLNCKLLINAYTTEDVSSFTNDNNFANSIYSVLYEHDLDYNPNFWKNYNLIKATPLQDSIIKQLESLEPLEEQFSKQFVKNDSIKAPIAKIVNQTHPVTGLTDNYYWLQDIENTEVLKYIRAENEYTKNEMLPLKQHVRNLYNELKARSVKDTSEIKRVLKVGEYTYYFKKPDDGNTENIYRKKEKEEIVLDIAELKGNNNNLSIIDYFISPDNKIITYLEYFGLGYESNLVVKDIKNKKKYAEIENVLNVFWKPNSEGFYYTTWNKINRIDRLMFHKLGTDVSKDELIYYEIDKSKEITTTVFDNRWLLINSSNDLQYNSTYLCDLASKEHSLKKIVYSRKGYCDNIKICKNTLYSLSYEDGFSKLYKSSLLNPERSNWEEILRTENVEYQDFILLQDYLVIKEKNNMDTRLKIYTLNGEFYKELSFNESTFTVDLFENKELAASNKFRYVYSSLKTPDIVYEYDLGIMKQSVLEEGRVIGYNPGNYKSELLWATADDGSKIPISLVYNKEKFNRNGKAPLYITTYGFYGGTVSPGFASVRISLLDRGVVFAIAHVRGGSDLGLKWHEKAIELKKKNTFTDFITCVKYLIQKKYTKEGKIIAEGGSAGGAVMGVAANANPELFNSIVLGAPYIDILNSVTDTTAKFSTTDYTEIGNPKKKEVFEYIKSYCPYQNISNQDYPNMLYYIGLNDTKVEYWQSLKSVAKLRALKTDNNKLYLKVDLYAGHNGGEYYANTAFIYAFILDNLGIKY